MLENVFTLDDRHWPLVLITVRGQLRGEEFARYLRCYEVILGRQERYFAIFDASGGKPLEVPQMKAHADWIRQNAERLQRYNMGVAFVISSAIVRGALAAILWLQPLPEPHTVVATLDQALVWVRARAQEVGLELPETIDELREPRARAE